MKSLAGILFFMLILVEAFSQENPDYMLDIGGAIRMNYLVKSWDESQHENGGELAYDMMRIDVDANYKNVITSGQIRFYSNAFGGILVHHAYIGYKFSDQTELHLGIDQVPFGLQTYASNNWFFNIGYYVGLEDDYDLGVQFITKQSKFGIKAAFFKNSEFFVDEFSRYSYDITGTHHETNQGNLKLTYDLEKVEIGVSGQLGQLQETATGDKGSHGAMAVHAHATFGRFDVKLQGSYFKLNPAGPITDYVYMSAYGAEYQVTTEAAIFTLGLMYSLPIEKGPLQSLDFYNDFGIIDKQADAQFNSLMNVLGCGVNLGKLYTYVDAAFGQNHPWLGPEWTTALSSGVANSGWDLRFNMNFGYYF